MKTKFFYLMLACTCIAMVSCSKTDSPNEGDGSIDGRYKVGDCYSVGAVTGLVYKISDGGKHGMIVSLDETATVWSQEKAATGATDLYDGAKNIEAIKSIEGWETKYPAFKWCEGFNKNGTSGWYLPSNQELLDLYAAFNGGASGNNEIARTTFNQCLVNNYGTLLSEVNYWSSSEYDHSAYCVNFSSGYSGYDYGTYFYVKTTAYRVRCVRTF